MKIYISTDFEGVAGIVDWDQIMVGSHDYDLGRRLLLGELNAAIAGAQDGGATEFVVNDSHSTMRNLPPDLIDGQATVITGKHKPLYMMQGLDSSFDAIFFIGYHGSIGASQAILGAQLQSAGDLGGAHQRRDRRRDGAQRARRGALRRAHRARDRRPSDG